MTGAINNVNNKVPALKLGTYYTDTEYTITSQSQSSYNVGNYLTIGRILCAAISNWDTVGLSNLTCTGAQWYSNAQIVVSNNSPNSVVVPKGRMFIYVATPYV